MRTHIPRDTPAGHASPSPDQCRVISPSFKLCTADIIAIVAVALFILYIVWGLPPTIRAARSLYARLMLRQRSRRHDVYCASEDDVEEGWKDPYLGPTKHLRSFLLLHGKVAHPERAYKADTAHNPETKEERERLDSFRFPPGSASPFPPPSLPSEIAQSPSASSISGIYSPPSFPSFEREEPLSPFSASFPAPPGLSVPATLGSPKLDDADRLEPLPTIPPPACLPPSHRARMKPTPVCKPCSR